MDTYAGNSNDTFQTSGTTEKLTYMEDTEDHRVDLKNYSAFHCGKCNTVLGDSLAVCGQDKGLDAVICLKVTKDVVIKDELEVNLEGQLAYCAYNSLHCAGCERFVGWVLHSTPSHLSALRNLFLLQKDRMNCYMFESAAVVKASAVNFEHKSVRKRMEEIKRGFEEQLKKLMTLKGLEQRSTRKTRK